MKLNCNVIQDLLPLYHDGVCSGESRGIVEAHLESCERCRKLLGELRGEIEVPHESPDDLGAMKKLDDQLNQGRKKAWLRGVCAALAVVLVLGAALAGLSHYENKQYQARFAQFAEGYAACETDDAMYAGFYEWIAGDYLFQVAVPNPGYRGVVEIRPFRWTKDIPTEKAMTLIILNLRLDADGEWLYDITIERDDEGRRTMTLDQNGQTVAELDEDAQALLESYRSEIAGIIHAAQGQWPFLRAE